MKTLSERLAWAREQKGLTQDALAKLAGVSQSTIGNLESGLRKEARRLIHISAALDVDPLWLSEGAGPAPAALPQLEKQQPAPALNASTQLGKTIKARLDKLGKTQDWLAEELDVSSVAVSKWIRDGAISRENTIAVARALGMTTDQLLTDQAIQDVSSTETTLERLAADERQLIQLYRRATADGRLMISGAAIAAPKAIDLENLITRP